MAQNNFQENIKQIKEILRAEFQLSSEEIKARVDALLERNNSVIVERLALEMKRFLGVSRGFEVKKEFAKKAVTSIFNFYLKNNEKISDDFYEILKEAKSRGINPHALFIEKNFKEASVSNFREGVRVLTKVEFDNYVKLEGDEQSKQPLFNLEQVKDLYERCASIVCEITEENVKGIMDEIALLGLDEKTGEFTVDPKELIRKCPSILLSSPSKIAKNIEFLENEFVQTGKMSRMELAKRVAESPTLLTISLNKSKKMEESLANCLLGIGVKYNLNIDYQEIAHSFCSNIDNLITIDHLPTENIQQKSLNNSAEYLVKFLGAENAIKCLTNHGYFLKYSPAYLAGLLEKVCQEEKRTGKSLRKYLIEHASSALGMFEGGDKEVVLKIKKTGKKRDSIQAGSLPKNTPSGMFNMLKSKEKQEINQLVSSLVETIEKEKKPKEEIKKPDPLEFVFGDELKEKIANFKCKDPFQQILGRAKIAYDAKYGAGSAQHDLKIDKINSLYEQFKKVVKENTDLNLLNGFCKRLNQVALGYEAASQMNFDTVEAKSLKNNVAASKDILNKLMKINIKSTKMIEDLVKQSECLPDFKEFLFKTFERTVYTYKDMSGEWRFDPNYYLDLFFVCYADSLGLVIKDEFGENFEDVISQDTARKYMEKPYLIAPILLQQYGTMEKIQSFFNDCNPSTNRVESVRSAFLLSMDEQYKNGLLSNKEKMQDSLSEIRDFMTFLIDNRKSLSEYTYDFKKIEHTKNAMYIFFKDDEAYKFGFDKDEDMTTLFNNLSIKEVKNPESFTTYLMNGEAAENLMKDCKPSETSQIYRLKK